MNMTQPPSGPVFIESPLTRIPEVHREMVIIAGRSILIERPWRSDRLLDDPVIQAANIADDYMPYWADIWPAARMMAKVLLRENWQAFPCPPGEKLTALELGCGVGVAGIAGLMAGLHVIFSDYDLTALRFAERNAKLNGFCDFRVMPLDWRFPPEDLKVPVILAADLTYEMRNIDPLLALIRKMLLPDGICFLTDPDRTPAPMLRQRLTEEGFMVTTSMVRAGDPSGDRTKGTLYRIRVSP